MIELEILEQVNQLYMEMRAMKERIAQLEAQRSTDGKVVISGAPRKVQDFLNARKQEGGRNG